MASVSWRLFLFDGYGKNPPLGFGSAKIIVASCPIPIVSPPFGVSDTCGGADVHSTEDAAVVMGTFLARSHQVVGAVCTGSFRRCGKTRALRHADRAPSFFRCCLCIFVARLVHLAATSVSFNFKCELKMHVRFVASTPHEDMRQGFVRDASVPYLVRTSNICSTSSCSYGNRRRNHVRTRHGFRLAFSVARRLLYLRDVPGLGTLLLHRASCVSWSRPLMCLFSCVNYTHF